MRREQVADRLIGLSSSLGGGARRLGVLFDQRCLHRCHVPARTAFASGESDPGFPKPTHECLPVVGGEPGRSEPGRVDEGTRQIVRKPPLSSPIPVIRALRELAILGMISCGHEMHRAPQFATHGSIRASGFRQVPPPQDRPHSFRAELRWYDRARFLQREWVTDRRRANAPKRQVADSQPSL